MYKLKILNNTFIYEIFTHLRKNKNYTTARTIIIKLINFIQKRFKNISPIYLIEMSIFNLLIPLKFNKIIKSKIKIVGILLSQAIRSIIIKIINYSIFSFKNKPIYYKLSITFIQIYKKEHTLYDDKKIYLNKILNI